MDPEAMRMKSLPTVVSSLSPFRSDIAELNRMNDIPCHFHAVKSVDFCLRVELQVALADLCLRDGSVNHDGHKQKK